MTGPLNVIQRVIGSSEVTEPEPIEVPASIQERIRRGRDRMREGAPKRNECLEFSRGNQYRWVDSNNSLKSQATTSNYDGRGKQGKPRHRVRAVRNYIFDFVEAETAGAVQRVPGYDVLPTSAEPKREAAARLAKKIAYYGFEKWRIRKVAERVIRLAVVADEGFAWPYFDTTVGPFLNVEVTDEETGEQVVDDETGEPSTELIGQGEIRIRVFGPNEVMWEPGIKFDESRWHAIQQARDIPSVMESPGYVGGKLDADGQQSETSTVKNTQQKLVLVTDYLERPSPTNPKGMWLTMANGRVIVEARPYPCMDGDGNILDEPVLHKLTYAEDPDSDRDMGLVRHLIDSQRSLNHSVSKIAEWINLALNPQVIVMNGRLRQKLNDVPGAVFNAVGQEVKFRQVPNIPPELFTQKEEAISDMGRIGAYFNMPGNVGSRWAMMAILEQDTSRRANFLSNLAEFHSRLMRHCLYLVQMHYTEPRDLKITGPQGVEPIKDFLGSEMLGEVDVRVTPESIEPRTRQSVESKIMSYAQQGWISPHAAMQALNNGTAEGLIDGYERDVERANLIIQKVKEGPKVLFDTPPRRPFAGENPGIDEETGAEREYVPGWMPRPFDNVKVQRDVIEDWMKGTEYDELPPPSQEAINTYYDALLQHEASQQAEAAAAQEMTAQSLGMSNAAKQPIPPPLPDQAAPELGADEGS
jgi:hypothetical protein